MFERFTEQARKAIFYARYECAQAGSPEITPQHLLLALVRSDSGLRELIPAQSADSIRTELLKVAGRVPDNKAELPFSTETKRALAAAAEVAKRLNHPSVGTIHELIGVLREPSPGRDLLLGRGISLEKAMESAGTYVDPSPSEGDVDARRAELHALVDALPIEMLSHVRSARDLFRLRQDSIAAKVRGKRPEAGSMGSGAVGSKIIAASIPIDFDAASWGQIPPIPSGPDDTRSEWTRVYDGNHVRLLERFHRSEDGKTLHCTFEVRGPRNSHRWSVDLDLS